MKASPKNWLSLNKKFCLTSLNQKTLTCLLVFWLCNIGMKGQTNLVPNGSFETYTSCPVFDGQIFYAAPWTGPANNSSDFFHSCANPNKLGVPYYNGISSPYMLYQPAVNNGNGYAGIYTFQLNHREYLEVPLTSTLEAGKCYYGEFFAVNTAIAKYCTNNIAGSFGNIMHPTNWSAGSLLPLPQHIINYGNKVIKDTLIWQKVSGLYQANGTESVFTIGNFKDNSNTDTVNIHPPGNYWYSTSPAAYVFIDAVSVYSINPSGNLPWSYRDTTVALGDSVYIGNNMGGNFNPSWFTYSGTFINNGSGIYVKPVVTSTYVVQFTVCGVPRSDTLQVSVTGVGINELNKSNDVKLYPNPAQKILYLELSDIPFSSRIKIVVFNNLGQIVKEEKTVFVNRRAEITVEDLPEGMYHLEVIDTKNVIAIKKFVIFRQ